MKLACYKLLAVLTISKTDLQFYFDYFYNTGQNDLIL